MSDFFKGIKQIGPIQITSSDNPTISTSLYPADEVPEQVLGNVYAPEVTASVVELLDKDSSAVQASVMFSGIGQTSFLDDFRYRLIYTYQGDTVDGQIFDQGIVTENIPLQFGMWNGFPEEATISFIVVTAGQGVQIEAPSVGTVMTPLQEIPLEITVLADGPAVFEAMVAVQLSTGNEVYTFTIKGTRLSIPYLLDAEWSGGFTVSRRYLTSVFVAANAEESRTGSRVNPVRQIQAPLFFNQKHSAQQAWASIHAASTSQFIMPFIPDQSFLDAPSQLQTVYCETQYRRFSAGGYAIMAEYAKDGSVANQEVFRIAEVFPDRLESVDFILRTYPEDSVIFPAMICVPALSGTSMTPLSDWTGTFNMEAKETYGDTMLQVENTGYVPEILNNAPVAPFIINWGKTISIGVTRAGSVVSSGSGQTIVTRGTSPSLNYSVTCPLIGRDKSWEANGFVNYIYGMGKKFWVRGLLDMFTIQDYTGGAGLPMSIFIDPVVTVIHLKSLEALWITDENGDKFIAKVTNYIEDVDKITIVTEATSAETIAELHDALLVRLSSDEINETYLTDSLSELSFNVMELPEAYE